MLRSVEIQAPCPSERPQVFSSGKLNWAWQGVLDAWRISTWHSTWQPVWASATARYCHRFAPCLWVRCQWKNTSAVYEHIEVVLWREQAYPEHSWTTKATSFRLESDINHDSHDQSWLHSSSSWGNSSLILRIRHQKPNLFCFVGRFGRAQAGQHQQEFPGWSLWVEARETSLNSRVSSWYDSFIQQVKAPNLQPCHLLVCFGFFSLSFSLSSGG